MPHYCCNTPRDIVHVDNAAFPNFLRTIMSGCLWNRHCPTLQNWVSEYILDNAALLQQYSQRVEVLHAVNGIVKLIFANWQKWHHKCNENLFSLVFLTTMISFCTTSVQNFWAKSIIFDLVLCDFLYLFILSNFCWKKILKSKLKWKWHHKCAKYFLREPSISVPG